LINYIDFLSQNWVGSLIGILGILIGLIIAAYYYRLSRIGPRLVYQINTLKIIGKDERIIPDDVKIFFRDIPVERIIKNVLIIWNSGYSTFDGANVIKSNPICVEYSKDTSIMRVTALKRSRLENLSQAKIDSEYPNRVLLSFDYLDPNDGAVFEIYHTGDEILPKISGTIKGLPNGIEYLGRIRSPRKETPLKIQNPAIAFIVGIGTLFLFGIFVIFIFILIYSSIIALIDGIPKGNFSSAIFLLVPIFPLYLVYDYWIERRKFPKSLATDELNT